MLRIIWLIAVVYGLERPEDAQGLQVPIENAPSVASDIAAVDYDAWLDEQKAQQEQLSQDPEDTAIRKAHFGNWLLATYAEPAMTRFFYGRFQNDDSKRLLESAESSLVLFDQALADWPADPDRDRATSSMEVLRHFAQAMRLFALAQQDQLLPDDMDRISTDLAILLDEDNHELQIAALFWQSLLYWKNNRTDLALSVLPTALEPTFNNRTAFFARITRSLIIADSERSLVSLALLLKMEERCSEWFVDDAEEDAARCSLTLLRHQLSNKLPPLRPTGQALTSEMRERCLETLNDEQTPCRLLRLNTAVPMLFGQTGLRDPDRSTNPNNKPKRQPEQQPS